MWGVEYKFPPFSAREKLSKLFLSNRVPFPPHIFHVFLRPQMGGASDVLFIYFYFLILFKRKRKKGNMLKFIKDIGILSYPPPNEHLPILSSNISAEVFGFSAIASLIIRPLYAAIIFNISVGVFRLPVMAVIT